MPAQNKKNHPTDSSPLWVIFFVFFPHYQPLGQIDDFPGHFSDFL